MADLIPYHTSLDTIYTKKSLLTQGKRWHDLLQKFSELFGGQKATWVSRAPGRVNIIGEHIDYSSFSVLPSAIERDVLIAGSISPSTSPEQHTINLHNVNPKYAPKTITWSISDTAGSSLTIPKSHEWSNYVLAALKGLLSSSSALTSSPVDLSSPKTINLLFDGNVPAGGGVSSSAAMVTSSGLTLIQGLLAGSEGKEKVQVERRKYTELVIENERLVGVNSGGMDQSASVFSQPQSLLHIEFLPTLSAVPVPLPAPSSPSTSTSFVISNSLITSDKAITAPIHYNLRVVECRIGALILSKRLSLPIPSSGLPTYRSVMDALYGNEGHPDVEVTIKQLDDMVKKTDEVLGREERWKNEGMTWEEVYEETGLGKEEFETKVVRPFEVRAERLMVWKRGKHVFTESSRVYQFRSSLESLSSSASSEETSIQTIKDLGNLMNQSMDSCQEFFECSCPELDEMVEIGRKFGSYGSRLTGAGWGGCTVHLIPESLESEFIKNMKEQYYSKKFPNLTNDELESAIFSTKPESGACIYLA